MLDKFRAARDVVSGPLISLRDLCNLSVVG